MRRLAIGFVTAAAAVSFAGSLIGSPASASTASTGTDEVPAATEPAADGGSADDSRITAPPVHVLQVSGLFDEIVVDSITNAIDDAESEGAQALILQVNTRGSVVGDDTMEQLMEDIDAAPIPIGLWVGPSSAKLYGRPAQLLAVADVSGMAPGARVGYTGTPLHPEGVTVEFGDASDRLRRGSMGLSDAREFGVFNQRITDEGIPTLKSMLYALDGYEENGVVLHTVENSVADDGTPQQEPVATVIMTKLSLTDQIFHTVASPSISYLLLLVGLALLIFEFFTAGVGIAGVVGAGSLVLACTGLAALPIRGWALAMIVLSMIAFAVDVQVGIPRFWTGVGIVGTIIGSFWLFESLPGATLRPSWITLLTGVGGITITFVTGMPSMVRTRFATPTIGREWMIGEIGHADGAIDPDGIVTVGNGQWRARTNRATPIAAGDQVRVAAIDGVTLEVEPLEGAAKDYRERRSAKHSTAE
ncbi:NfeD family protein [Desertimonas flava]|uniref:NfeD family protein n=1 Tax=Desertimonas flava TaxID=2064846 RepID=UPI000E34297E|nr:NfeD family protein [Desertimonas flava]